MAEYRDQLARLYAASLLNRLAGQAFDHRDVAVLARIVPLIEDDVLALVRLYADEVEYHHSVAPAFVRNVATLIEEGRHRPELPQVKPAAASLEGNLK